LDPAKPPMEATWSGASFRSRGTCEDALSEIQAERFSLSGRKPKLGELVQEALDAYNAKERKRTNVRTKER
jgi:hypothetical protein